MPRRPVADPLLVGRLSLSITRLARVLRQQETSRTTPAETAVLATIVRDGPITLGDLATAEQVSPSTITKIVSNLEADGQIERVIDPDDRRVHRVQLSARGRRNIDVYRSKRNAWLEQQMQLLEADELARLIAAVDVLEHLIASEGNDPVARVPRR
jgi:DNA-binding MarR family transcriptional regulator